MLGVHKREREFLFQFLLKQQTRESKSLPTIIKLSSQNREKGPTQKEERNITEMRLHPQQVESEPHIR